MGWVSSDRESAAFELRDKEHLAAFAQLLEIAGLVVDFAVDRDGRFGFEVHAEPGLHLVERPQDVTQALRLDLELALAAGIAAAEPARQHDYGERLRGLGRGRIGIRPRPAVLWACANWSLPACRAR